MRLLELIELEQGLIAMAGTGWFTSEERDIMIASIRQEIKLLQSEAKEWVALQKQLNVSRETPAP